MTETIQNQKYPLITLCSSHVGTLVKIKWMNEMINSWNSQSFHVPLYISISLEDSVKPIFEHYLNSTWKDLKDLTFIVSDSKLSQFNHYKILCEKMIEKYSRDIWIIFTDDDDLWEKDRALYFKTMIDNLKKGEKENEVSHIQIPTYCVNYKDNFDEKYDMRNLEHIELINDFTHQHIDYWQFACQIKYLKDYIDRCSPILLNDGFCNLYFVKYFYNNKTPAYRWYTKDKKRYVYYWRGSAGNANNNNIHLLDQLKKKSPEETIVKIFLQEVGACNQIREKNKDGIKNYVEKYSKHINHFDNKKMKSEINDLFYSDKYDAYINSPVLENVIR